MDTVATAFKSALRHLLGQRILSASRIRVAEPARELWIRTRTRQWASGGTDLPVVWQRGNFYNFDLGRALRSAFDLEARRAVALPNAVREIEGMSGQRYRDLINALIESLAEPRYLEVGSWAGSTAAAALHANRVTAVCIDNWSQFGGPREQFFDNTRMVLTDDHDFRFIEADFRRVDYHAIGTFNVFLFDGPHTERDQYDGVVLADPALAEDFILIVDDWNWRAVRIGTMRAIADRNWTVEAAIEIRTTMDESHPLIQGKTSDWHNGYFLAAIRKHR